MKKISILSTAMLLAAVVTFSSCSSGRQYQDYPPPPPPRTSVSLILDAGPGMVISRYGDGRYYYRNPQGYTYWRGYGNRYYLDNRYMRQSYHRNPQYRDWRTYRGRR